MSPRPRDHGPPAPAGSAGPTSARSADELFEHHQGIARSVARRYSRGGRIDEDLEQVARLGVLVAARRFDPAKGDFAAYATAMAAGEVKKHLRNHGWVVRVPRRLQEDAITVAAATDRLTNRLGRPPDMAELASHVGLGEARVSEATEVRGARFGQALDAAPASGSMVDDDAELALVRAAVSELDSAQQELVRLRFEADLTQHEIGERIGISQAQVHRRLSSLLAELEVRLTVAA